ncbi:cAMP-binding domain of CRP or a regulatory subunit of cAMP-dependent protein kinases [Tenacibaculum sp. MAR_2009_124]|uniref:Crp/Fnr family transcriptional regulator n=1 Tax=Tenacibaculum sp. MAR_2009_124 TaxID=1250059 RepID=UPI0008966912|nr:Crp/Fnr family transcriptional regulator [Tenacibaculum sp. MAR_2009_124]SEC39018.1 cAMP-binding domain of CRP or a regulatory subunit of cAMP-dependent protein kinases [Tenacibaculum sp. MAR_2009_124]
MNNLHEVSNFFKTSYPLNEHGLEELFGLFKTEFFKRGDLLLKSNTKEKKLRFLNSGTVREFYADKDRETNINFYIKPQFISDLLAFNNNTITNKNQECLTAVEILSIERNSYFKILEKHECGKSFVTASFQKLLHQKEIIEFNRVTKSPEDLYKDLFKNKPQWLKGIPQYHIASYLNITPETLSRIRKRIS